MSTVELDWILTTVETGFWPRWKLDSEHGGDWILSTVETGFWARWILDYEHGGDWILTTVETGFWARWKLDSEHGGDWILTTVETGFWPRWTLVTGHQMINPKYSEHNNISLWQPWAIIVRGQGRSGKRRVVQHRYFSYNSYYLATWSSIVLTPEANWYVQRIQLIVDTYYIHWTLYYYCRPPFACLQTYNCQVLLSKVKLTCFIFV